MDRFHDRSCSFLNQDQAYFFKESVSPEPHVTIALAMGYTKQSLGHMLKEVEEASDWTPLDTDTFYTTDKVTRYSFVGCLPMYRDVTDIPRTARICLLTTEDEAIFKSMDLPTGLWSTGDYDIGCAGHHTVVVQVKPDIQSVHCEETNREESKLKNALHTSLNPSTSQMVAAIKHLQIKRLCRPRCWS